MKWGDDLSFCQRLVKIHDEIFVENFSKCVRNDEYIFNRFSSVLAQFSSSSTPSLNTGSIATSTSCSTCAPSRQYATELVTLSTIASYQSTTTISSAARVPNFRWILNVSYPYFIRDCEGWCFRLCEQVLWPCWVYKIRTQSLAMPITGIPTRTLPTQRDRLQIRASAGQSLLHRTLTSFPSSRQ